MNVVPGYFPAEIEQDEQLFHYPLIAILIFLSTGSGLMSKSSTVKLENGIRNAIFGQ